MYLGHYGISFIAKKYSPQSSLGLLFFATQFLDILFPIFCFLGLESAVFVPNSNAAVPFEGFVPFSHSLIGAAIAGLVLAGVLFVKNRDYSQALVVCLVVISHWILDFISHNNDMRVFPSGPSYGLGLWNSLFATLLTEFVLFAIGLWSYGAWIELKRNNRFLALIMGLIGTYLFSIFSPARPSMWILYVGMLLTFLFFTIWAEIVEAGPRKRAGR